MATMSAWQRDALHALAETPNLTGDEYDRRKAEIQADTTPPEDLAAQPATTPSRHGEGWTNREIRLLYDNRHLNLDQLAELLGRKPTAVKERWYRLRLSRPVQPSRGARVLHILQSTPGVAWPQAELASTSGCSRQVTNAVLGALRAAGVVTVERVDGLLMFKAAERGDT